MKNLFFPIFYASVFLFAPNMVLGQSRVQLGFDIDGEGVEEVCSDVNLPKSTSKLRTTGALASTLKVGTSLAILHVKIQII
jgi:hypothetical protein